jgi:hypothetical protein
MTRDIVILEHILKLFLDISAFFTTLFVVMYWFSPWFKSHLGRAIMLQAISLALALDMTVLFQYWQPEDILVSFWIQVLIFGLISVGAIYKCVVLWQANYKGEEEQSDSSGKHARPE